MKSLKRIIALMLALMLSISPVSTAYATGVDGSEDSSSSSTPTDGTTESQPVEEESKITMDFNYGVNLIEGTWCNQSADLKVTFKYETAFETVTLSYVKDNKVEEPVSVTVGDPAEDGSYSVTIPAVDLTDGKYLFTAYAKGTDGYEGTKTFELMLDTTCVSYESISLNGISVVENVAYAKDSFTVSGFSDALSGVKSIIVMNEDNSNVSYNGSDVVELTSDVKSIVLEDHAGNVSELSVSDITGCESIVYDSDIPVISLERDGEVAYNDGEINYYNGKYSITLKVSDDNLNEVLFYRNGELVGNSVILGTSVNLAYSFEESQKYEIKIIAKDKSGNEISHTETFVVDTVAPEKGSLSIEGTWFEVDGNLYINSAIVLQGTPSDALSGYSKIGVIKDGDVVSEELPYTILESGTYGVKVYDNVGNCAELSLADIIGSGTSSVVVDAGLPVVSVTPITESNEGWYKAAPTVSISASDDNLSSVKYTVVVDEVEVLSEEVDSALDGLQLDLSKHTGAEYTVSVVAVDKSGNEATAEYSFHIDNTAPHSVSVTADEPSSEKGGNVYYNNTFTVTISATDDGYGNIVYYLDDKSSTSGKFTGVGAGEHTVRVEDGLGNTLEEKPLSEYTGWSSNTVVIVSDKPVISADKHNGTWVSVAPKYSVGISDNSGINYYKVEVNGSEVDSKTYDSIDQLSAELTVDLSNIESGENGSYTVTITVENNSGLTSTWSDTVNLDTTAPKIGSIVVEGTWNETADGVYSGGSIVVTGEASDSQSGVKGIKVFKDDTSVSTSLPFTISETGSYKLVITDNVGNSAEFTLASVMGTTSNSIIIDTEVPTAVFNTESVTPDAEINGINWFGSRPTISVTVEDNSRADVTVVVVADEKENKYYEESISEATTINIDTSKYAGSQYTVTVTVVDDSGNSESVSYSFVVDESKPGIGDLSISSEEFIDEKSGAYTKVGFVFTGSAVDEGSGIASLVVYRGIEECFSSTDGSVDFSIVNDEDSGGYSIKVIDNVGNSSVFTADTLLGSKSDVLVIDKVSPAISRADKEEESSSGWYNYIPSLKFSVSDANIKTFTVKVNDSFVKEGTASEEFELDMSAYTNMVVTVSIYAEDIAGNYSEFTYEYTHDNTPPVDVSVSTGSPYVEKCGNVYLTDKLVVIVTATDAGFGDMTYFAGDFSNKTGEFTISADGEYTVYVKDGLGNTVETKALSEYLGWSGNNIIFVSAKPEITANGFNNTWVGSKPAYTMSASDAYGINSYVVSVNGTVIKSESFDTIDVLSTSIEFSLADVTPGDNGKYSVEVVVENNAGLTSKWTDIVNLDTASPNIGSITVEGDLNEVDGKVFSGSAITVTGNADDSQSGIASVVVYKGSDVVANALPFSITESGSYSILITDNVGNTKSCNLNEVMGTTSNDIVIDEEVPSLAFDATTTEPDASVSGVNWFATKPVITVNASDNNKVDVRVVVVSGETEFVDYEGSVTDGLTHNIDISKYDGTDFTVVVTATDDSGNDCSISYFFKIDSNSPESGELLIESEFVDTEIGAFTGGSFVFTGSAVDVESGIAELIIYKEGTKCFESTDGVMDYIVDSAEGSGSYSIVVIDRVGNQSTFSAKELLGSKSSVLVVDNTKPVVERIDSEAEFATGWFNYTPVLKFKVSDTNIKSYTVYVNDSVVHSGTSSEEFEVDMSAYKDMSVSIKVVAEDYTGNTNSCSYSYKHDSSAPADITASSSTSYTEKGGNVYFTGKLSITIGANDAGYDNLTYYLNDKSNQTGKFTISENGTYFVKVADGLGNESESIPLSELMGWASNNLIFDSGSPTVSSYKYNGQWVAKSPVYTFGFSDNYGIDNVVITVNGTELLNQDYSSATAVNESATINTADATVNEDGSYNIVVVITDNSGLSSTWTDTVYLDDTAPAVTNFEICNATNSIGGTINGKDSYGFFFDGSGTVTVVVADAGASSGVKSIWTRLEGYEWVESSPDENGKVSISVPKEFKGKVEAYAVDNVGNVGAVNSPDLLVSESAETHEASDKLVITLPNTEYTDANGLPLYNGDIIVDILAGCTVSGINHIQWGVGELSDVLNNINGVIFDKNLITEATPAFGIIGNENGMKVIVKITDMVGHSTEAYKFFSIDKDKPVIEVTYDTTTENGHYNVTRTATIKVTERNFNPDLFTINGVYGELDTWSNEGGVWTTTITFKDNNEYKFTLDCTDRAGNSAVQYVSENFVVDKTSPVISRVDENKESKAGWYNYTPELKFQVSESYISAYEVYINDDNVLSGNSAEIVVDTSKYANMPVSIMVYVVDEAGNTDEFTYSYQHDNTSPINIAVEAGTPATQKAGTVYFNGQFDIIVSAEDGIGYGDLTYYLNDVASKDGKFTISKSGSYSIKVVDGLGHESAVVTLGEYCGWNGNTVVINNTVPTIEWVNHNGNWLADTYIYDVNIGTTVGIDSIIVTVNGTEVINNSYDGLDTIKENIKVDISKATMAEDSSYNTVITVVDNSGLVATVDDIVYVDLNVAEMGSMGVDGEWEIHGDNLYTKGAITVNGTPVDTESGIKSIEVLRDGTSVGTLPYTITESGVYGVRVTDNVDNQIVYSFAEIAGIGTSNIVWDDTYPDVYFDLEQSDKPQYTEGTTYWYASNPMIYIGMTDTNMESVSVTVTIDGTKTVVVDNIIENGIYAIDTAYAQGSEFKIVATARDKSGNLKESTYEFRVDSSKPNKGNLAVSASPEWIENGNYVYIRGQFSITGYPVDAESGIKSVTVYYSQTEDGAIAAETYADAINIIADKENMSGFYTIEVVDNVGNVYTVKANELLGSTSNNFIVDLTDPTITKTDTNVETKTGWYNYAPVFTYEINDTYINKYTVYVNEDVVLTGSTSETVSVDTAKYQNQDVTVHIEVVDRAGNTAEYSYSYKHDNTPPANVNIEMREPVSFKGDNVYYNDTIDLVITASDAAYGDISYYINGTRIEGGMFTISKSGEYNFEVVDGLGNTTTVKDLVDFFGWSGNNIVIDGSHPVISTDDYDGAWLKGIGSYDITITDNLGIDSIVATVNGVNVVNSKTDLIDLTSTTIELDTSEAALGKDGSVKFVVTVTDNSGLTTTWEDVVYVDNVIPTVDDFVVYGDVHRVSTESGYGYFFNGNGTIEVVCSDGNPSSGIESIWTRLSGQDWIEHKANESGVITIKVPADFKGTLEAYVVDKVGNKSEIESPAKLISETTGTHSNNAKITITLPETPYTDINGLPLYSSDAIAGLVIGCEWSGLQYMEWGIEELTKVTNFSNGVYEDNIVTQYSQNLPLTGNANGLVMSVNIADWADNKSSESVSFSIDKDVPTITVTFDTTVNNGYYNATRVAHITVNERNFDASQFTVGGNSGTLGTWANNGTTWTNTITFAEDGDYAFTLDCVDRAGNKAAQYVSEEFTIDKTAPVMTVTWDNDNVENGMYYKEGRVATVTVVEHNFDGALFALTGNGTLSGWTNNGDTYTAVVRFDDNGEYEFSIDGADMAGNGIAEAYGSGRFIIDLTAPVIEFERVTDGVSYKDDIEFLVTISDTYINNDTKVYLSGKLHDEIEINGQFIGQTGTFSYTNFPEEEGIDDIYTIRVVAVDNAGNVTEDSLTFSVNRFGSKYSFYDAEMLGNYIAEPKDVKISEVNVDRLDITKVVVTVTKDGKEIEVKDSWIKVSEQEVDNKFLYTYTISKEAFNEDGKYSVTITSQAKEGTQYTSVAEQYDFIVDKTAPVVIISGIEDGEDYREYSRTVAVDVRDLSGVSSIKFFVNGEEVTNYTENEGIYSFTVTESGDTQSVTVEVVDMAGNKTTSSVDEFLITSNLMVYLLNQFWFLALIAIILFLIIWMIIMLLLNRRKDKDDEQAALAASGELYRSTAGSGSSGTTGGTAGNENQILSGEAPTVDQHSVEVETTETVVMDSGESTTGFMDDNATGVMDDGSGDTGAMD